LSLDALGNLAMPRPLLRPRDRVRQFGLWPSDKSGLPDGYLGSGTAIFAVFFSVVIEEVTGSPANKCRARKTLSRLQMPSQLFGVKVVTKRVCRRRSRSTAKVVYFDLLKERSPQPLGDAYSPPSNTLVDKALELHELRQQILPIATALLGSVPG
jgi:hypothetical protein